MPPLQKATPLFERSTAPLDEKVKVETQNQSFPSFLLGMLTLFDVAQGKLEGE